MHQSLVGLSNQLKARVGFESTDVQSDFPEQSSWMVVEHKWCKQSCRFIVGTRPATFYWSEKVLFQC